jgi:predicted phage-related endonuclease
VIAQDTLFEIAEPPVPTRAERVPEIPGDARVELPASAPHEMWLAERRKSIGGSDIAVVAGAGKYGSSFEVFRDKAEGWVNPRFEGNAATEWGHRLEAAVVGKAVDELGLIARPGGQIWRSPRAPYVHVTPDAFVTRPRSWKAVTIIEAKTAGDGEGWEDGGAPLHYRAQLQTQLHLLGLPVGYLACLELGQGRNFYLVEVPYDRAWAEELVHAAERFWVEHVLTGEPPMLDPAHPRTRELLNQIHPKVVRESVDLPPEAEDWRAEYHALKADADKAATRLEEMRNWIAMHLGDAGAGYIGEHKLFGYSAVTTSNIDPQKLREEFPEAAAACTVTGTYRRLTVSKKRSTQRKEN